MTFTVPPIDDTAILTELPGELAAFLSSQNGFIKYHGGLHLRGATFSPKWHSLRWVWRGEDSPLRRYKAVRTDDVPFAEDALGDQFILRGEQVLKLYGETGATENLGVGFLEFIEHSDRDPIDYLELHPLEAFRRDGGELQPGQLLSVYPPFCTIESRSGVSYRAVPASERLRFLSDFQSQSQSFQDGTSIRFRVREE